MLSSIRDSKMHFLPGPYASLCCLLFLDFDNEELEKELYILLQDTTKEPSDLPDNPYKTFDTDSVPNPRISDAELEAELEKLSLSEGGTELYSQGCWWAWGPLADSSHTALMSPSPISQFSKVPEPGEAAVGSLFIYIKPRLLKHWDDSILKICLL